jgi:hypothetical protein
VLIVGQSPTRYKYLDWYPKADSIASLLRREEPVTIWTDRDGENWVWQVEQGGKVIASFDEIRETVKQHRRFDWAIGGAIILVGLRAAAVFLRRHFGQA